MIAVPSFSLSASLMRFSLDGKQILQLPPFLPTSYRFAEYIKFIALP